MLTVEQIAESLKVQNKTKVARDTGLSRATIYRIIEGNGLNLTQSTIRKLSEYLAPKYEGRE